MNPVAVFTTDTIVFWNGILSCLAVMACFFVALALYSSVEEHCRSLWCLLPLAVLFSVLLSRFIHWYCHEEQYAGFLSALTDYSSGGYCLPGAVIGTVLAALLLRVLKGTDNVRRLLDCVAPGAALGIGLLRLGSLFNSSCRSKIVITDPRFQRLPLGSPIMDASGAVEYRFATFFADFLVMLLLFVLLLVFFFRRRKVLMKGELPRDGHTALMFLVFFSAAELLLDSTRYDSSFLPINGFVSIVQIISAVSILFALILYSVRSLRVNGLRLRHWILWAVYLLGLAGTGVLEYLVQRHGGWYLRCYSGMAVTCLLMAVSVYGMYLTICQIPQKT